MLSSPLGNIPIDKFLSEYWQKKPLLIRNALPGITSPVNAELLAGLACEEEIESRIIIQHEKNNQWELKHGPFSKDSFSTLPKSHWTLLVQAVDHWLPEAAKFLDLFTFIPHWRIDDLMISYASKGGGVGPHFDNYDVFLVQTNGKRKWEVGKQCGEHAPLHKNLPVSILSEFNAIETWLLEPGDILYLPPRFSHNGIAYDDNCITCSVGFRAPSHNDILREYTDYIGEKLSESQRYKDPDLITQNNTGEISQQTLKKVQQILQKYTHDKDSVADWFGRYITTPKYSHANDAATQQVDNSFTVDDLRGHFSKGESLFRNESSRFAFEKTENKYILFVDGHCFKNPNNDNNLIEILCENIEIKQDNFTHTDNNLSLLVELLQNGALYIAEQ